MNKNVRIALLLFGIANLIPALIVLYWWVATGESLISFNRGFVLFYLALIGCLGYWVSDKS